MRDIKPEYVNNNKSSPYKRKQRQCPPKYLIIGRVKILLIDLTLELPNLIPFLIKVHPPSQPNQNPACNVLYNPKVNGSSNYDEL